jgi:dipeptidyl aminopeptidase/acylaminoacyl peptidase
MLSLLATRKSRFIVALFACTLAALPISTMARERPAAEAFAALPTLSNLAISADGKKLAYGAPSTDGNLNVVIFDLITKKAGTITLTASKLRGIQFEDGGQVLVTASGTSEAFREKAELFRVFAIDLEKGKSRSLLTEGGVMRTNNTGFTMVSLLPGQPNLVAMSAYDAVGGQTDATLNLYKVALDSNAVTLIARGNAHTYQWLTDPAGNPIARADLNLIAKTTTVWTKQGTQNWREALRIDNTDTRTISLRGISARGSVLFIRDGESEFGEIEAINPTTGQISVILKAEEVELSSIISDPYSEQLLGVEVGGLNPDIRWSDPDFLNAQATIEGVHPNKIVTLLDFTPDHKIFLASTESASEPRKFFIFNSDRNSLGAIGPAMPSLNNVPMGQVRATTFKSRDGVDIPVYVTTPPGHNAAKNAPTIIFPHGGPASRDEPRFDWWAQFMASRGYVVIQPQFRGSTGFGMAFADAGVRQWGKRMQDDVSDAVAWAVKEGTSDAGRICIVGASYGGYAALAGATMTPELYKCAVSVAGVADLPQMMREERADAGDRRSSSVNYWASHIGSNDRAAMEAASPRRLAGNVRAPILLIHGKDDTVVKFEQSQVMARALKNANKPHKLVELAGEDHWLSRAATRLQMLGEIDGFLIQNLGPGLE